MIYQIHNLKHQIFFFAAFQNCKQARIFMRNGEFWGILGNFKNLLFSYNVNRCSFNCNVIPDGELNCLFVYYVNFKHVVSVVTRIMADLKE